VFLLYEVISLLATKELNFMKQIAKLTEIFNSGLGWNKARADLLSLFLVTLIKVRSVNLTKIAVAMPGSAKTDSKYKRLQRFFAGFDFSMDDIAELIVRFFPIRDEKWDLSMDRTNWKSGKLNINPLVLGIIHLGCAFPVIWTTFSKRGCSNMDERIEFIERFIKVFSIDKINCLFGDREFIGGKWFGFLLKKKIHFIMRIKENFNITDARGIPVSAKILFRELKVGEYKILKGKRLVCGQLAYVIGALPPDGEFLILATDKNPETALENYKKRWGIETLFQCLKGRGFNFEDTHMTFPERIDKLIALLAIAFSRCYATGEWCASQKPIRIKKHGRKCVSVFRLGSDHIGRILHNISELYHEFNKNLKIILEPLISLNSCDTL
jgi:hypothetical protein